MTSDSRNKSRRSYDRSFAQESEREDLVVKALQECQHALDQGKPIDRDGLLDKYAMIRDELSACLDGMELMQGSDLICESNAAQPALPQIRPLSTLGDFRLVREIGRGGMGVVYEAEQLSVGRRVALKVLPYAAMLDRRQIARFQNEAKAAATLEHPHIVPVYFVGTERGVYFYAMRLVHGQDLADLLVEMRGSEEKRHVPDEGNAFSTIDARGDGVSTDIKTDRSTDQKSYFASVARLGMQVAEAIGFAHSRGIIHRDIKPANILLDEFGDAWVTDFGLARVESDISLTMTGDLIGTLRYMSPEQVESGDRVVDHRSDIYSLGATLYELLTLRPVFDDEDRDQLRRKIALVSPRSPSRIDPKVPRDLETIVLKAMNKVPQDRYATAEAFADDLRRFLSHKPIQARRTPVRQRLRLLARRHPLALTAATLVCVIALMATSVVGFILAKHEHTVRVQQQATADKLAVAYREKESALDTAKENLAVANEERSRADRAAVRTEEARLAAEAAVEELRQLVYLGDMRQAYSAWSQGWTSEVETLLRRQIPKDGQSDFRGFEWDLLNQLTWNPPPIELQGHTGPVRDLCLWNSGTRLASVGKDSTIRLWDIIRYQEDCSLTDGRDQGRLDHGLAAAFGNWVDSESDSATLASNVSPRSLAVSPGGELFVTGSHLLTLWDLQQRKIIRDLAVFPTRVFGICFSPDGQFIAAHSADESLHVFLADGTVVLNESTGGGRYRMAFSPDGSRLFAPYDQQIEKTRRRGIRSWDTNNWTKSKDYPLNSSSRGFVTSHDGEYIYCGCFNGPVYRIHLHSGVTQAVLPAQRSRPTDIAIASEDTALAVAYSDGTVAYAKLPDPKSSNSYELQPQILALHVGAINAVQFIDERRIATAGDDGSIRISEVGDTSTKRTIEESLYNRCRFRPGCDELILATRNGFRRYDTNSLDAIAEENLWDVGESLARSHRVTALSVNDEGNLAAIGNASGSLVLYDLSASREVARTSQQDVRASDISDIAFSPDGKWIADASSDHTVRIRMLPSLAETKRLNTKGWGANVAFSPDGRLMACSDSDGELFIIETGTWHRVAQTEAVSGFESNTLIFTNDGSTLISGHHDSTIRIWSVDDLTCLAKLDGHGKPVRSMRMHPDGKILISASGDRTVRLWHLPTRSLLGTLESFSHTVWDCDLSSSGSQLIVATAERMDDGACHIWSLSNKRETPSVSALK